jgi:hypothetical protein
VIIGKFECSVQRLYPYARTFQLVRADEVRTQALEERASAGNELPVPGVLTLVTPRIIRTYPLISPLSTRFLSCPRT